MMEARSPSTDPQNTGQWKKTTLQNTNLALSSILQGVWRGEGTKGVWGTSWTGGSPIASATCHDSCLPPDFCSPVSSIPYMTIFSDMCVFSIHVHRIQTAHQMWVIPEGGPFPGNLLSPWAPAVSVTGSVGIVQGYLLGTWSAFRDTTALLIRWGYSVWIPRSKG